MNSKQKRGKSGSIEPGSFIQVKTKQETLKGTLIQNPDKKTILLKLSNGYNIGIPKTTIQQTKILKKPSAPLLPEIKQKQNKSLPNISFIITGGTIASKVDYETGAVKWLLKPKQLLSLAPNIQKIANIKSIESPFMIASENMSHTHWQKIAKTAAKLLNEKENQGVIVTHGTDTLHYTAAALSFMLKDLHKPLILTYSQRSTDRGSSDTSLNLTCSTHAALSNIAEVLLVGHATSSDNHCIAIRGTKARKSHTSRRDTFRPINDLPIAKIHENGRLHVLQNHEKRHNSQTTADTAFEPKTALIKYYPGASPEIFQHLIDKNYKGIVIEATGLGHVATKEAKQNWLPAIKRATQQNIAVAIAPQTLYGRLNPLVYSPGRELIKLGIINCQDMLPETAYIKLGYTLGHTQNKQEVKQLMETNIAGEINKCISPKAFLY